jgi:GT2 family glycosyltransferase
MFKLSIGIVSYNRPFELQRTIKSLMPLPEGVEVIICDDKSPRLNDILSSINYLIDNEKIRFIINETNLGYDQNLFQVIELAYADHVLLLGDDDYLEPGAIDNVLNFIGSDGLKGGGRIPIGSLNITNVINKIKEKTTELDEIDINILKAINQTLENNPTKPNKPNAASAAVTAAAIENNISLNSNDKKDSDNEIKIDDYNYFVGKDSDIKEFVGDNSIKNNIKYLNYK